MMTKEIVESYIKDELGCEPRHCCESLAIASEEVSIQLGVEPMDVLQLVLENQPLPIGSGITTHSYGFHTREGRGIINLFQEIYYETQQ